MAAAQRNQVVHINVGGQLFHTTTTTLTSTTGHYLARLFAAGGEGELQGTLLRDDSGVAFIDRDPKWFGQILNFLRDGFVPLPDSVQGRLELRQEALFYCLQPLADQIEAADPALAFIWAGQALHPPCADTRAAQDAVHRLGAQQQHEQLLHDQLRKQLAADAAMLGETLTDDVGEKVAAAVQGANEQLDLIARRLKTLRFAVEGVAPDDSGDDMA